jgi:hypothetical protein
MNEEGFSVTECLGGSMELSEQELELRYQVRIPSSLPVVVFCDALLILLHSHSVILD